ncbi:MAG: response regulator transcription factor [Chthoniobacterales bacterium]|nr:response regulator transcription factor [Chthoniobacterales bacterium]
MKTGVSTGRRGIIVVDDHPLFRKGVIQMLSQEADLEVRAEAETAPVALDLLRRTPVDLAIVDIGLHGSANGIELTKSIKAEHPHLPVLVLSMHDETLYADRALRAGAGGYLMKREALDSVIAAVRSVLDGEIYLSPTMAKRMIADHLKGGAQSRSGVEKLTDRELEVLQLIGEGKEMRAIAAELHLSAKTVEAHRSHIKEKLNFSNAREVARFAVQWVDRQRQG